MLNSEARTNRPPAASFSSMIFLLVLSLGYAVYAADRTVLAAVLLPMKSSLLLTNSQVGLLGSAVYIGVLSVVFLAGHLSDRYGRWPIILLGVSVFTCFTWLVGFSTNFTEAFVSRVLSGIGEGLFWPVAMAAVASHFKNRKGLGLSIFYVGFDVGSVAGLSIGGIVYYLANDNWRPAFFVAPSLGLLVIAGAALLRKRLTTAGDDGTSIRLGRDAFQLIKQPPILLLMVFAFLATWASVWQVVFLPYYYKTVMHYSVTYAALLASLVSAAGAVGKLIIGTLSDIWKRNRMLMVVSFVSVLAYALFFESSSTVLTLFGALTMSFFSASIFPVMQSLMADSCGGKIGTALGLSTSAQSVATVFSPIIAASLFTLGVGRASALDAMIPATLAVLVALMLREPRKKVPPLVTN